MKNAFHKQNQQWKKKIKGQLKCKTHLIRK